jgi:hypothetical protein
MLIPDEVGQVARVDLDDNMFGPKERVLAELKAGSWEYDVTCDGWWRRSQDFIDRQAAARTAIALELPRAKDRLAVALAMLDLKIEQIDGPPCAISPARGIYDLLVNGTVYSNRTPVPFWISDSADDAIKAYVDGFRRYLDTHSGEILYWRVRPELRGDVHVGWDKPSWLVYSRLHVGGPAPTLATVAEISTPQIEDGLYGPEEEVRKVLSGPEWQYHLSSDIWKRR